MHSHFINKFIFKSYLIILLISQYLTFVYSQQLPDEIHEIAKKCIDNLYNEKFKAAKINVKQILKKYPEDPAGYFFYAVVLQYEMEYQLSLESEDEFYHYCDESIINGERILEKYPDDMWAKFFIAGSNGLKGKYEARFEKWITAFKHGWTSIVLCRELLEKYKGMVDLLYGISTYNYWRCVKTKLLLFLPGVEERREESIKLLYDLQTNGFYTRESASIDLIRILINEKRYIDAISVADSFLKKFPVNLLCLWERAKAQYKEKQYNSAEKSFISLLNRVTAEDFDNNCNIILCKCYLIKIFYEKGEYSRCIEEYKSLEKFKISGKYQKIVDKDLNEVTLLYKRILHK